MKFFVAIALFAAVASARLLPADLNLTPVEAAEVEQIMAAIHSPSTDPTTAAMLKQMLLQHLGVAPVKPPTTLPAIVDQFQPIHVGPAVIDFPVPVEAITPTPVAPVAPAAPAAPAAISSPMVQIIVNVNQQDDSVSASPVLVDSVEGPSPVQIVEQPEQIEINPTPVNVVDEAFLPHPVPVAQPDTLN